MRTGLLAVGLASVALFSGPGTNGRLTIDVTIHHSHFSLAHLDIPAGTTVRFVIHNTDPIEHEFIVGSAAVQYSIQHTAHPAHDGSVPGQISIPAGTTRETTYRFGPPEPLLFGCHLPGHYRYGMRGTISVT